MASNLTAAKDIIPHVTIRTTVVEMLILHSFGTCGPVIGEIFGHKRLRS